MKVRFASSKERSPDQENGLKVLYGPSRRVAYKLRWYLILLLVGSPLLWVFGRLGFDALQLEVPAQLSVATTELRALDSGTVQSLPVKAGQRVQPGQLLVQLDNPDWRLRMQQLQPANQTAKDRLGRSAKALQLDSIGLQGQMVDLFRSLQQQGAISTAELLQSKVQLNGQRLGLLDLQRRLRLDRFQVEGDPIQILRDQRERDWLATRLRQLSFRASELGRVEEVLVNPGENVGPGTLLMRIERPREPLLWIYLKPAHALEAQPGNLLEVRMPDGSWRQAQVLQQADLARRLPPGLHNALGSEGLALQVPARFLQPLPPLWHVDQLPLQVRFPFRWPWLRPAGASPQPRP